MVKNQHVITRSQRQAWLKAVSNPRNGYEWALALSDPYSPIYKDFIEELMDVEFHHVELLEIIFNRVLKLKREEREYDEAYARKMSDSEQALQALLHQPKVAIITQPSIKGETVHVLQALHQSLSFEIKGLVKKEEQYKKQEAKETKKLDKIDDKWKLRRIRKAIDFIAELKKKVDEKGKAKEPDFYTADKKPIEMTPKLLEKVQKVVEAIASPTKIAKVHPQVKPEQVCVTNDLVCEFNMHKAIQGMDDDKKPFDPSAFLKALKANKNCKRVKSDDEEKEMAGDAIKSTKAKLKIVESLKTVQGELNQKRKLLNHVKDELNALGARPRPPGHNKPSTDE